MPDVEFGEWLPDQKHVKTPGLTSVVNMTPSAAGWQSVPDLQASAIAALDNESRGVFAGRTQSGNDVLYAADAGKLYEEAAFLWVDRTRAVGGDYALTPEDHWEFGIYGDAIIAATKGEPIQRAATPSVAFADIDADAPQAGTIAIVGEFLMAGNIIGRGVHGGGTPIEGEGALHWSAQGDPTLWPLVGTAAAINAQSDFQYLQGDGGKVVQIVPAAEYTAVFRSTQVWRCDYVGAPNFFYFRTIDYSRGMAVPNTGIAVGNFVYFLSSEGFLVFNGARTESIGYEKVDRAVVKSIDWARAEAHTSVAHVAALHSVVWSLPMKSGPIVNGNQNVLIGYNYHLKQFWNVTTIHERVFSTPPVTEDLSLDGLTYGPLDMDDPSPDLGDTNLDTLGAASSRAGVLSVFDTTHAINSFSGSGQLQGVVQTGSFEMPEHRRGLVRNVRPVFNGEGVGMSATVYGRNVANTAVPPSVSGRSMQQSGVIPARSVGRYHYATFNMSGPVEDFQGFDFKAQRLGGR